MYEGHPCKYKQFVHTAWHDSLSLSACATSAFNLCVARIVTAKSTSIAQAVSAVLGDLLHPTLANKAAISLAWNRCRHYLPAKTQHLSHAGWRKMGNTNLPTSAWTSDTLRCDWKNFPPRQDSWWLAAHFVASSIQENCSRLMTEAQPHSARSPTLCEAFYATPQALFRYAAWTLFGLNSIVWAVSRTYSS